jgi:hypothetical protein
MPGVYKINPNDYQTAMIPNTEQYAFSDSAKVFGNFIYIAHYGGILALPHLEQYIFHPKVFISKTTVSGEFYLLNKTLKLNTPNDVITLDLASLDYRPGVEKNYRYSINNSDWNYISGNQLTLTGLSPGNYHIEIMATNSLGQWSKYRAYTEVSVAYPWYWAVELRIIYLVVSICIVLMSIWLLYLRTKSISHIHTILQSEINNCAKTAMLVTKHLQLAKQLLADQDTAQTSKLIQQSITELKAQKTSNEPDSLHGSNLAIALPFLANYMNKKYHINLTIQMEGSIEELNYELQADIYKIIFEAISSAILNGNGRNFKVQLQEFKDKLWLTISDDASSFKYFNSKITFNMSMYFIRQIATKYNASMNTFNEKNKGSQLVLSIPLMEMS